MIDENTVKVIVAQVIEQIALKERARSGAVTVGISNRHIHLCEADLESLFGTGHKLKTFRELSQPGQFAAEECLTVAGPKGVIEKVRILGPIRKQTQVEISITDSFSLGIPPIVRDSGDVKGTPGCVLIGPKGAVNLKEGLIVASRHIHLNSKDAEKFGLKDMDRVSVKSFGSRSLIFNNVLVRVSDQFALDFHLDCDEANAACLRNGDKLEIIG
ncbi:phosphate propanoyltransferase [bacterium]|nr:phosphate propanoyltransferase [bacterium]